MNILAIESSCDETAAAIIEGDPFMKAENGELLAPKLLSNVVVSQIDIFKEYGGVIPEVAARNHLEAILPVIHRAMKDAGCIKKTSSGQRDDWDKIDAIAVTHTPGLLGSLLIGTLTARTLAILHDKPLYAIHHLKSHIYATWLQERANLNNSGASSSADFEKEAKENTLPASLPLFPLLALVVSGGHTQIIYMDKHNHFDIIGTTLDDAIGECFDKVAKILGLPYPGGPSIANAAKGILPANSGNTLASPKNTLANSEKAQPESKNARIRPGNARKYRFPHPKVNYLDFSFSGLKTAVLRAVQKELGKPISFPSHELAGLLSPQQKADFSASFQDTAVDILLEKLQLALDSHADVKNIVIAGGVSANQHLRWKSQKFSTKNGVKVFFPEPQFSGDNAAMVAIAAFYEIASGVKPTDPYKLDISPRSSIC